MKYYAKTNSEATDPFRILNFVFILSIKLQQMFTNTSKIECYFPFYYLSSITFPIYPGESGNHTGKRTVITLMKPHWRRELFLTLTFPGKKPHQGGKSKVDHKFIRNPISQSHFLSFKYSRISQAK